MRTWCMHMVNFDYNTIPATSLLAKSSSKFYIRQSHHILGDSCKAETMLLGWIKNVCMYADWKITQISRNIYNVVKKKIIVLYQRAMMFQNLVNQMIDDWEYYFFWALSIY